MPITLYRYLSQRHINTFFEHGRLRLSSFAAFATHQDEQRQDGQEGEAHVVARSQNYTISAEVYRYDHSLVLSTSTLGSRRLMEAFNVDGCFRINDARRFGELIGESLDGCVSGVRSPCIYRDVRRIMREIDDQDVKNMGADRADPNLEVLLPEILRLAGNEPLFLKPSKYQDQCEYRFVWQLKDPLQEDFVMIDCPEAVAVCERGVGVMLDWEDERALLGE